MNIKKGLLISVLTLAGVTGAYFIYSNTGIFRSFSYNAWYPMGSGFYYGHMMTGGIMHFIFWLFLVFFIFSAFGSRRPALDHTTDSAVELLKKKYVNGDINKDEFTDKMNLLNG